VNGGKREGRRGFAAAKRLFLSSRIIQLRQSFKYFLVESRRRFKKKELAEIFVGEIYGTIRERTVYASSLYKDC
jgi:hypothetical protein